MSNLRGLSVIVPTRNEAANLPLLLARLAEAMRTLGSPYEVLVVDDDSPDRTAHIASVFAEEHRIPLRVLVRRGERGLASAVVHGARHARHEVVAVLDADLSHDPSCVPAIARPVIEGRADLAVGSRYAQSGTIGTWPRARRIVSRLGTRIARTLTSVRDPLSGFFAARRALVDGSELGLVPRGYKILLEILARSRGRLRICEVPIHFEDRHTGASKFGMRQALEFATQLGALAISRVLPKAQGQRRPASVSRRSVLGSVSQEQETCP